MRDLNELKRELAKYESELQGITKTTQKDTPFGLHQLDGHSESYTVAETLDHERAKYLNERIASLKSQIDTYAFDAERVRKAQERKEAEDQKWREDKISSTAQDIYNEKVNAYMQMNLWGKAQALFSGKKPKKMGTQEIIQTYGEQAVEQIIAPGVEEILRQKEEQLASIRVTYANDPKMLDYAINATEKYFNMQLESVQKTYDSTLSNMNGGGIRK